MSIWTVPATVLRIVDGDTIRMELDLGWHTYRVENCRIAGINAPEMNTDAGKVARDYAAELLPVNTVVVFVSKQLDKYGRPLGSIARDGVDFGGAMIAAEHAVPYMI